MKSPTTPQELNGKFLISLAVIGALGSMAIHMIVPALPSIASDLGTNDDTIKLAISLYLISIGLGQLVGGMCSDHYGRKPVLLLSTSLFVVGSLCCGLSSNVELFLGSRIVQAFGGGAAIVAARAIISDLSNSEDVATKVAGFTTVLLMSPAIAPFVGGVVNDIFGWAAIFALLIVIGLFIMAQFFRNFTESKAVSDDKIAALTLIRLVIRNRRFWAYAVPISCGSAAMFLFLSGSPFLLINTYGLSSIQAGMCYLVVAGAGIIGTLFVGRLEKSRGAFRLGLLLMTCAGLVMVVLALLGLGNIVTLIGPMVFIGAGAGLSAPSGIAGVMKAVPGYEGTSSSIAGAFQMLITGLVTSFASVFQVQGFFALAVCICLACMLGFIIAPRGAIHNSYG